MKPYVPDTFQLGAIFACSAFLAFRKINKLRIFNTPEYSNSPRLHHFKVCVIYRLQLLYAHPRPDGFHFDAVLEAGETTLPPFRGWTYLA